MTDNIHAMIVDDHPLQLMLLEQALSKRNIITHTFDNVDEAFASLNQQNYDFIFCDLQMPDKDGIDMMLMLNESGYQGKVVLVSGMGLDVISTVHTMCLNFSFQSVDKLVKPYKQNQIDDLLQIPQKSAEHNYTSSSAIKVTDEEFINALACGQVINYYQPLVDFKTSQIVGYEALARWIHPEYGVLAPFFFLPIVKREKLSGPLFDVVFNNALKDIKQHGLQHKISLNVEQASLEDENFAINFLKTCGENGINPARFTIEVTERDVYESGLAVYKNLSKLRLNYVTVSIDDFGTGNSTFEKLVSLPFNEIKIDRSFINNICCDLKKKNVVESICNMAHTLNIDVVAEGIEDQETLRFLDIYGIDFAQGYYFNKPMPIEKL